LAALIKISNNDVALQALQKSSGRRRHVVVEDCSVTPVWPLTTKAWKCLKKIWPLHWVSP